MSTFDLFICFFRFNSLKVDALELNCGHQKAFYSVNCLLPKNLLQIFFCNTTFRSACNQLSQNLSIGDIHKPRGQMRERGLAK